MAARAIGRVPFQQTTQDGHLSEAYFDMFGRLLLSISFWKGDQT